MSICSVSGGIFYTAAGRFHELLRDLAEEHDREVSDLRTQLVHAQNQIVLSGGTRRSMAHASSPLTDGAQVSDSVSSTRLSRGLNKEIRNPSEVRRSGNFRSPSPNNRRLSPCMSGPATLPGSVREGGCSLRSNSELPPIRGMSRGEPPSPKEPPPAMPLFGGSDPDTHTSDESGGFSKCSARTMPLPSSAAVRASVESNTDGEKEPATSTSRESSTERPEPPALLVEPVDDSPKKASLLSNSRDWLNLGALKALVPGTRASSGDTAGEKGGFLAALSPRNSNANRTSNNNRVSFNLGDKSTASINYMNTDAVWHSLELSPVWQKDFTTEGASGAASTTSLTRRATGSLLHRGWVKDIDEANQGCSVRSLIATPSSSRRLMWEIAGFCFLIYDMVMIPLQVYEPEETQLMYAIGKCCTAFWTLDIFASFLVGYHTQGFIEMRLRLIAWRYIKSWFLLDVVIVSMDWAFFIISRSKGSAGVLRLSKFSRGFRVLRLLRIMKFTVILSEMVQRIHSEYKRTMIGILKIVFFIIIVNHFIACGFYGLMYLRKERSPDKYWVKWNFDDEDGLGYRYWTSMHWSLTQFTPASMEVVPRNSLERFYTVSVMFVALITFSSFISSITNAMTRLRQINASQMEQEAVLHRYLSQHAISRPLVARILHLIQDRHLLHTNTKARAKEEDVLLFKTLPDSVKNEVRLEAFAPVLVVHPLFFEYSCCEVNGMRRLCRSAVAERTLIFHEELFGAGRSVTHMVFIREGMLIYSSLKDSKLQSHPAQAGSWVCEAALWADVSELPHPFTAMTASEIVTLNARDFGEIVRKFVATAKFVQAYAKMFMEHIVQDCNHCAGKALGMHDVELLRSFAQAASDETNMEGSFAENRSKKRNSLGAVGAGVFSGLTKEISHISNVIMKKSKTGVF